MTEWYLTNSLLAKKKAVDKTGDHKLPPKASLYNIYMLAKMAELKEMGVSHKDAFSKVGAMWSAASDAEKKPYVADFEARNKKRD